MRAFLVGILVLSGAFPISGAIAAQSDVGPLSCSQQRDSCVAYRFRYGPAGSEDLCVTVFNACMRSGVWNGKSVFPYGGTRIKGMIRQ
jgi:hypothetical protein